MCVCRCRCCVVFHDFRSVVMISSGRRQNMELRWKARASHMDSYLFSKSSFQDYQFHHSSTGYRYFFHFKVDMKAMKQECFFNKRIPDFHDVRRRDYEDLEDDQGKKKRKRKKKASSENRQLDDDDDTRPTLWDTCGVFCANIPAIRRIIDIADPSMCALTKCIFERVKMTMWWLLDIVMIALIMMISDWSKHWNPIARERFWIVTTEYCVAQVSLTETQEPTMQ